MPKCYTCRKEEADIDTWWDRVRLFFFYRFGEDVADLSQQKYTQGFADGYKSGWERADTMRERYERTITPS